VTAGTSIAQARTEPDQKTCYGEGTQRTDGAEIECIWQEAPQYQPADEQSGNKQCSPQTVSFDRPENPRKNAADTGDLPIEQQHGRGAKPDEDTAYQG
jgi:hypothetical protein